MTLSVYIIVSPSYGVSALVGESESQPSQWVEIPVPPRLDQSQHLQVLRSHNLSASISITKGIRNQNCRVSRECIYNGENDSLRLN